MKIKDIEGKLKKEQNSQEIPDVLQRAKKAPINRLLDGQTPLKAFDKQTAVRLLWCAMLLLVTVVLAIGTIALIPSDSKDKVELAYVNVEVESGDENFTYGIVVENGKTVAALVLEEKNGVAVCQNLQKNGFLVENAIKDVYRANGGDKVVFCVIGGENAPYLSGIVKDVFSQDGVSVDEQSNTAETLAKLKASVGETSNDLDKILNAYLEKY